MNTAWNLLKYLWSYCSVYTGAGPDPKPTHLAFRSGLTKDYKTQFQTHELCIKGHFHCLRHIRSDQKPLKPQVLLIKCPYLKFCTFVLGKVDFHWGKFNEYFCGLISAVAGSLLTPPHSVCVYGQIYFFTYFHFKCIYIIKQF